MNENNDLYQYKDTDREDYTKFDIDIDDQKSPLELFSNWFDLHKTTCFEAFNACSLTTVSSKLKPHTRIVLMNNFSDKGFIFYSNYESRKGKDLSFKPYAQLLFFFKKQQRVVHIWGDVEKVSKSDSIDYFNSRPLQSRLAAMVSKQSQYLKDRKTLEHEYQIVCQKYQGKKIVCPNHWGGYRLKPDMFEFWQGRPSRLHDRVLYEHTENNNWKSSRLYP